MGLAKPPCCHDAGGLLHHRFSFSLYALRRRWESSFLRRFPSDHSARPLAGIPPSGARTFLTRAASSTSRDRLAHSAVQECSTPLPQATAQHKRSHDKPRTAMRYNGPVDGQRRQSRRDRAPHPSVYSVCSRLLPEAGCRHFSCTDNPIANRQPGQHCARAASRTSAANAKRDPSIADGSLKQVIVKPIYSASVSSSFFSEGSGVTSISTPRVSAADFMDREIRRRSRSISMTLT